MKYLEADSIRTFRWECFRSAGAGAIEAAGMTVLLLIAVRHFALDESWKSLVATAGSSGLILSPLVVYWVQSSGMLVRLAASRIALAGAFFFFLMVLIENAWVFSILSVLALTCASLNIPLVSSFHQKFFPPTRRGSLFSRILIIRIISVSLVSWVSGWVLGMDFALWKWVALFFGFCFLGISRCYLQYPVHRLEQNDVHSPLSGLRWVRQDRLFFWTLSAWMVMGFGNLMMLPLRIEYLSDSDTGVWLEAYQVALLTAVVPGVVRLAFVPIWGRIFDNFSLFRMRIVLNMFFALNVLIFFHTVSFWQLIFASVVFGIAHSGGDVAWNLWVTRLAPAGRAADYMAVHTFTTGLRGFLAPFAGFAFLEVLTYSQLAWISAFLMVSSGFFILKPALDKRDILIESERSAI